MSCIFERMFTPPPCVKCQVSHVICQVSGVICQVSGVICQVSGVRCQVSLVRGQCYKSFWVELVGGGSVINGAYHVYLFFNIHGLIPLVSSPVHRMSGERNWWPAISSLIMTSWLPYWGTTPSLSLFQN